MNGEQIIAKFELYVDDSTELSSDEELDLANDIYHAICDDRPWEWLKKEWSGTTNGTTQIDLPDDFKYFIETGNYTDNSTETEDGTGAKYVFVNGSKYLLINWSDRRQYENRNDVCWVDILNNKLVFAQAPDSGLSISADYIHKPDDLTTSTSPIFPSSFHKIISHGMAIDDMIIQLFEKARSYADENQAMYDKYMRKLALYNSQLQNL